MALRLRNARQVTGAINELLGPYKKYDAEVSAFGLKGVPIAHQPHLLINVVGGAFAQDQFPLIDDVPNMPVDKREHFAAVRAKIREGGERPDATAVKLGKAFGKMLARLSNVEGGFKHMQGITVGSENIMTKEGRVPFKVISGKVIEFGAGINGVMGHVPNLHSKRYHMTSLNADPYENVVLDSMSAELGVQQQTAFRHSGLTLGMRTLLNHRDYDGEVDAIIASRVHGAPDLVQSPEDAYALLRSGGVLALRGPQYAPGNEPGYNAAANTAIEVFGADAVLLDEEFMWTTPYGKEEPNRTIILQKPEN